MRILLRVSAGFRVVDKNLICRFIESLVDSNGHAVTKTNINLLISIFIQGLVQEM